MKGKHNLKAQHRGGTGLGGVKGRLFIQSPCARPCAEDGARKVGSMGLIHSPGPLSMLLTCLAIPPPPREADLFRQRHWLSPSDLGLVLDNGDPCKEVRGGGWQLLLRLKLLLSCCLDCTACHYVSRFSAHLFSCFN